MSLCCCGGCGCASCDYTVIFNPPGDAIVFSSANINLSGIGCYDSQSGNTFQFRGVDSANALLTVSLDATNHTILLTVSSAGIVAAIPQATPTVKGIGETAIDAEAIAKASTTVFITPSNFAAMGASSTFAGFIEIATNAEAIAGASTTLAITPANLAAAITANYGFTTTFANAVTRAGAVPSFVGQFGSQVDVNTAYLGSALVAGSWLPLFVGEGATSLSAASATSIALGANAALTFSGDGTSVFGISAVALNLTNVPLEIGGIGNTNALLVADNLGEANFDAIANYLSLNNVQTGYTAFTNPATIRTCNTATVTLQQLAQLVGTLVADLKAAKTPAT